MRQQQRNAYSAPVKISLLETDADEFEEQLDGVRKEMRAMRSVLVAFLVSLATASLLLAINLVISAAQG